MKDKTRKPLSAKRQYNPAALAHALQIGGRIHMPHKQIEPEPPLVVHLTRTAGVLTLCGGVILLVAANAVIGVAIILLSALYFALAEIIAYLAVIARNSQAANPFFREEPEEAGREMDIA